jgi:molybdopterin-containing oxidoreductase family iron-sulfur binding subunit
MSGLPVFWRSIDEAASTPAHERENLDLASAWQGRREFLKALAAASAALAGVAGCARKPFEAIVPYVRGPPQSDYGKPVFYATACVRNGYALGVLVETNMGRPTKVEGNPAHPASAGATDIFAQASVLDLWDPSRSQSIVHEGAISTWEAFLATLVPRLQSWRDNAGRSLRILTESVSSPTLAAQLGLLLDRYPNARWHQYQPLHRDAVYLGTQLAFGAALEPQYRFDRAQVIVSLDAGFLDGCPGSVRYARDFSATRRAEVPQSMSRLYAVESTPRLSGAAADHRLALRPSEVDAFARGLAHRHGVPGVPSESAVVPDAWMQAVVSELSARRGRSLVIAGDEQPAHVHAIAHWLNWTLGNVGETVLYTQPVLADASSQERSLADLTAAMHAGAVEALLILGGNPAYYAPADLDFAQALRRVPLSVHWGLYQDETAALCRWHIPAAHEFEAWSDARAFDGTLTIMQPLLAPLYAGKSRHEVLAAFSAEPQRPGYDIVRAYWRKEIPGDGFEQWWRESLRAGVIANSAFAPSKVAIQRLAPLPQLQKNSELELIFRADPTIGDGSQASNAWLQELPKSLTQLTWDNAVCLSPNTARELDVENEEVVQLHADARMVEGPVWIVPGHPERAVSVHLGYGRTHAGPVGSHHGFNAYLLRISTAPWNHRQVSLRKTGRRYGLACVQTHHTMHGRDLVRLYDTGQADARIVSAATPSKHSEPGPTLYPAFQYPGYRWGMSVNLTACIGCGACTIACQAENNISVVGKEEVARGREMHWIRVDRYYEGKSEAPRTAFQPVPCMHCEHAPCEPVCPVEASVHDAEGLNVQVYNRCIGTRFCSNNCPYKVRRFNFLQYAQDVPSLNAQRNPEVTVRMRGVMEKCNYCLQRITDARIEADRENRRIRDGEVITACQAACPTHAIVFGDLNDPASAVNRAKSSPLTYTLLEELNTRPRTTYIARVINPARGLSET